MNEELDESIHRKLFLSDTFPSAVLDSATSEIRDANHAFEQFTSLSLEELRGRQFNDVLDLTAEWHRTSLGSESLSNIESTESGPWRLVRLRRPLAEEKERRSARLSATALLAAGIAHDFNNALMAALPWADLLARKYPEDGQIQTAVDHIRKSIFRGRDITHQLLDFAQPSMPKKARQDLVSILREQTSLVSSSEVFVHFDSPAGAILAEVDASQLARVVRHLLTNAHEAIEGPGKIEVRVSRMDQGENRLIGLSSEREYAMIEVSDNGRGITTDVLAHVFDPFFTTKSAGKGPGLGLSIALRVIERHGGTIRAESAPGEGTTVKVYLPALPTGPITLDRVPQGPLRILLIDDEESIAEGMRAWFELSGIAVTIAASGEEGLGLLSAGFVPDGIVLDLGLPGIQGSEVHRLIRSLLSTVPIIISSGWTAGPEARELLADGYTRLKQKPYDPDELLIELEELLR